jgi:hypothetical protein
MPVFIMLNNPGDWFKLVAYQVVQNKLLWLFRLLASDLDFIDVYLGRGLSVWILRNFEIINHFYIKWSLNQIWEQSK